MGGIARITAFAGPLLGGIIGAGTMLTLGSDLAPRHARGEFLGIWRFIGDGRNAGAPWWWDAWPTL